MNLSLILPHYSPKNLLCASLLLLVCFGPSPCFAGDFDVPNVVVDADGKDTTDARDAALMKGEKDAFSQLILRLAPAQAAQVFPHVSQKQVSGAVRSFQVVDEKMTATHYHATINYSFDPNQIRMLVPLPPADAAAQPAPPVAAPAAPPAQAAAAPAATPQAERKGVLVLPVYKISDQTLELWQDENQWRNVWYEAALESGGGRVVVPLGDMSDRVDVDDTNVNASTPATLHRMYDRYGVGDIIVMQAYYDEKADPKPTLDVTLKKLSAPNAAPVQMNYIIHPGEPLEGLLARASNDIARTLLKQQTVDPNKLESDRLKEISARVNTTDIKEWQSLRARLLMRSNIVDVRFDSISYYETTMTITFKGTPDMLGKTLVASGLRVMQDGDKLVLSLK